MVLAARSWSTGTARYALEIDPQYVQAAVTRWEAFTGGTAIRQRMPRTNAKRGR
jgi:hypothetical protein